MKTQTAIADRLQAAKALCDPPTNQRLAEVLGVCVSSVDHWLHGAQPGRLSLRAIEARLDGLENISKTV